MTAGEFRTRRMLEILWALVVILIVMTFFNICTWPLLRTESSPTQVSEENSQTSESNAEAPSTTLEFSIDQHGRILSNGKILGPPEIRKLFAASPAGTVDVQVGADSLLALIFECKQAGISPNFRK